MRFESSSIFGPLQILRVTFRRDLVKYIEYFEKRDCDRVSFYFAIPLFLFINTFLRLQYLFCYQLLSLFDIRFYLFVRALTELYMHISLISTCSYFTETL